MATQAAPDHDFNNTWGSVLGVTELQCRPVAGALMQEYWDNPLKTGRCYENILSQYMDKFVDFFGGTMPISFHGHVTDGMNPTTIAGMLMRLAIASRSRSTDSIHEPCILSRTELAALLGWSSIHVDDPRWAVIQDSYAAGFGPIASHALRSPSRVSTNAGAPCFFSQANLSAQPAMRDHATGSPGICVQLVGQTHEELSARLAAVKREGCIGVVVEIVNNQHHGRVTTPAELRNLSRACADNGLLVAVDETITALRCGAPFAHQRPEYRDCFGGGGGGKPDLVFFGKALHANGVAINFDGPVVRRLGLEAGERQRQAVRDWQAVVTQAVALPVLIDALGVLEMAAAGDWVGRARVIGAGLRSIVAERARELRKPELAVAGGLDAFLFVHKEVAVTFLAMGASNAGPWVQWVRWLPRMDRHLASREALATVLTRDGVESRREASRAFEREGVRPQWCFNCGNSSRATSQPWCRTCCIDSCDAQDCVEQLGAHGCIG